MKILKYLLVFMPISIFAGLFYKNPILIFVASALAIVPLAGLLGKYTEEIANCTSSRIGGFLNATFGNATELILSFFALRDGMYDIVKASLTGSVIGNLLLVLGASVLVGGCKYKVQKFSKYTTDISLGMLLLSIISLGIPAVFLHSYNKELITGKYEWFSIVIAGFMFVLYLAGMFFSFYTHKDLYGSEHKEVLEGKVNLKKSIVCLLIVTVIIAVESEMLVSVIEPVTEMLNLNKLFIGMIVIPIVGNVAEHTTAVLMATKNKIDISIEIAIGSSLQVILFVMPVLVFLSLLYTPMSIVFNSFELISLLVAVFIVSRVVIDGKFNWLEGFQLVLVYFIIATSYLI